MENQHVVVQISGMNCRSCAAKIEKAVASMDGVKGTVDFPSKTARIEVQPGSAQVQDVTRKIEELGYKVTPLE
ncbi:heavy-metal-associated domain-containing protein [Paenibacillus turpanensis]|uniref:heavy-metal-associated domain-containing protein n=1 Tax=Paenibacillus turpanensis TaxID=2689078 RepID=UPI001408A5D4|nr:heavy metal-associated domain-containing protein [Paenibacillus turpanensis]